jgi:hypothetical protein
MKIEITKRVTFRDEVGDIIKEYMPGDIIECSHKGIVYYNTPMGGVLLDEAVELPPTQE